MNPMAMNPDTMSARDVVRLLGLQPHSEGGHYRETFRDTRLVDGERERTGYDVLLWLEREVAEGRWLFPLPEIGVHSANPVGRARMEQAIASIRRMRPDGP